MSHANVRSTTHRRGCRSDGKSLVTTEVGAGDQWEPKSVHLVDLDGLAIVSVGKPETLTPVEGGPEHIERGEYDWSPDGKRIVFRRQKGTLQEPGDNELVVADPDGKKPDGDPEVEGGRNVESVLAIYHPSGARALWPFTHLPPKDSRGGIAAGANEFAPNLEPAGVGALRNSSMNR